MVKIRLKEVAIAVYVAIAACTAGTAQEMMGPAEKATPPSKTGDGNVTATVTAEPVNAGAKQIFNQAMADLKRRDFKQAVAGFDKAIAAAPNYAAAYAERGGAQIGLGANELAVADLTKALELFGREAPEAERARLLGNRGLALLNQSKNEQAIADFDRAIEIDPKSAFAYANRASGNLRLKNFDAALKDVTRAIELRPGYEFAMLTRGYINNQRKEFADAAVDFQKVLANSPDHRGAILGLRQAYLAGKEHDESAKIRLVRLADAACEPSCPEWVSIEGKIESGSADALKETLREVGKRKLPVFVNSGGGSVKEAMEMGRAIRALGLDVVVTRTELQPCGKDDVACKKRSDQGRSSGTPRAAGSICASSCAFLLASGQHRYVGPSTLVGVHQITSYQTTQKVFRQYEVERAYRGGRLVEIDRRVVSETKGAKKTVQTATADETYVKIRKYFTEMGIDETIMPLLISAPPKGMHWLASSELKSTGMMTDVAHGEQLIMRGVVGRAAGDVAVKTSAAMASPTTAPASPAAPLTVTSVSQAKPAPEMTQNNGLGETALTKAIQTQLTRIGCASGTEDGRWGQGVRHALERYNLLTGKPLKTDLPSQETLSVLAARKGLVCPPACQAGLIQVEGKCVASKSAP